MQGSCHCKEVQFQITGSLKTVVNCHCRLCRKMNGAALSTYAVVADSDFELISGQLKEIAVSEKATKSLCSTCLSPVFNRNPQYQGVKIIHFGALDGCEELMPQLNIFCQSKLDWLSKIESLPGFEQAIERNNS